MEQILSGICICLVSVYQRASYRLQYVLWVFMSKLTSNYFQFVQFTAFALEPRESHKMYENPC